jgi:hypothetical protein
VNVNGLKRIPICLPDIVCSMTNENTVSPHASGKTKSQQKANNRKGHPSRLGSNCLQRQNVQPARFMGGRLCHEKVRTFKGQSESSDPRQRCSRQSRRVPGLVPGDLSSLVRNATIHRGRALSTHPEP